MTHNLVPCPACARHLRPTERACPFCAAPLPDDLAAGVRPEVTQRLSRAALVALGATLALGACSPAHPAPSTMVPGAADVAAAPAVVAALPDVVSAPHAAIHGALVAGYGAPPVAIYGAPPPPQVPVVLPPDAGAHPSTGPEHPTVTAPVYGGPMAPPR